MTIIDTANETSAHLSDLALCPLQNLVLSLQCSRHVHQQGQLTCSRQRSHHRPFKCHAVNSGATQQLEGLQQHKYDAAKYMAGLIAVAIAVMSRTRQGEGLE